MAIKLPMHFKDLDLWVEMDTWAALVCSKYPAPLASLFKAAGEAIDKQGSLIVHEGSGDIKIRCVRADELQGVRDLVDKDRRDWGLPPLVL